jgi:hypothetical protein
MKANEKGLPPPKMSGKRQAGQPASNTSGTGGGHNSKFNAFRELKQIGAGFKQYADKNSTNKPSVTKEKEEKRVIEYEGNQLEVNKDGSLKNPEELQSYRSNMALAFELQGDAPENFRDARVNFRALKVSHLQSPTPYHFF